MPLARTTYRSILALVALLAPLLIPVSSAQAVTRPETLYDERPVTGAPVTPGFPIDYVGVTFALPADADPDHAHGAGQEHGESDGVAVRFAKEGRWGSWVAMGEDGAQAGGQWTGALVDGEDADAYQIRGLPAFARNARVAALNTTDGPAVVVRRQPAATANALTNCKTRADWGADESLLTWEPEFSPIQVMTVHHTATKNKDRDPDARVRAIYKYHAVTNGWGDIGYQALIAENGTIYEGRYSGKTSTSCFAGGTTEQFGHLDADPTRIVTAGHAYGYNVGNFGIAVLGSFDRVAPKTAARSSLVNYLAEISKRHGIDAQGAITYSNPVNGNVKTVDAISGHRDYSSTACPGGKLYADLPAIRRDVAAVG